MMTIVHSFFNPSSRWYYPLRWLVLILLGLAIYAQTFGFSFVFDDNYFMFNTPYIRGFDKINQIWTIFPKTRMVGVYSFALNYCINRLNPQGYHIFNFGIHLLAVGLVWATAAVLFKIVGWIPQDLPFIIALLFLVHPCQTQAVTYISQRFESMATVFYIGSIYSYLCGRISSSKRRRIFLFTCSVGFAVLGILTKEVAVTIPLMILAVEFILLNRSPFNFKKSPSWKLYLLITVLGALFVFLFMKMVRTNFVDIYFHFSAPSESHNGDMITGGKYVLTQMRVFLTFLRLLILPVNQNADYDYPLSTGLLHPPLTLVGLCLVGFITFLIFRLRKQWPLIAFGFAWILIIFSINTAPRVNVIFEHKLYLISFGFFLATVSTLSTIIKDRKILFGLLIMLIVVLSLASYKRNQVWKNDLTLWEDVSRKSPYKARPRYNRGFAYFNRGNFIKAIPDFNKAIEINPGYVEAYINRGIIYYEEGNLTAALSDYNKAIKINPNVAEAYYNRGDAYAKQNNLTGALSDYNKAIELNPDYAQAYTNRGSIYVKQGNFIQALSNYNKAIEIYPAVAVPTDLTIWLDRPKTASAGEVIKSYYSSYADAYYNRGCVYDKLGNFTGALSDYSIAIVINSNYADAYNNRGFIYSRLGNYTQAISDFTKAIEINPDIAGYYYNRGIAYSKQGNYAQTIFDFTKTIEIDPNYAEAYYNRAVFYYELKVYDKALADVQRAEELGVAVNPDFRGALKKALE